MSCLPTLATLKKMLAYVASKRQFLENAPTIGDVVRDAVKTSLGISIRENSSEYRSWQNSLGNAMFHVLNTSHIPDDAGVAIEYQLRGRRQRIDVIVSGYGSDGMRSVVIIELKQWMEVFSSQLTDHVSTYLGGAVRDERHPSYQAWSYAGLLSGFYEVVTADPIRVQPCAFVHNCNSSAVLRDPTNRTLLSKAPVFIKGEHTQLQHFISENISSGDAGETVRRMDSSAIAPSVQLVESLDAMLNGNETFVLIDEQKTAFETIMKLVRTVPAGQHYALMVNGGPGTGKSVIAVNALVRLLGERLNVRYVTKNAAPRTVYKAKLQGDSRAAEIENLFVNSGDFHNVEEDSFDVLLVDEAHRLTRKSGVYGNLGENQIAELMRASRVCVFFVDEDQRVTWKDIGTSEEIASQALLMNVPLEMMELTAQFRCAGSDEYLRWVDSLLEISETPHANLAGTGYDVRVVDSPSELRDLIFEMNRTNNTSRLLAGYCWPWESRQDPGAYDIVFPETDFKMRWNLTKDGMGWMIAPNSIAEVGCIYTSQGLEGDYMGVIIGPDLVIRDGHVVTDPTKHAPKDSALRGWKSASKNDRTETFKKTDRIIKNTYRTLLTRGMRGTFIYSTDEETREFLKKEVNAGREVTASSDTD